MNVKINRDMEIRDAFRKEDYKFSVDWLNVRLDCDDVITLLTRFSVVFPELDLCDAWSVRESGGVCFYKEGLYLPDVGYSSVVISYNRDIEGNIINKPTSRGSTYGVLVSISGDGCRYFESCTDGGFIKLLDVFSPFNPVCTRIDIACDIFDKDNQLVPMLQLFTDFAYNREEAPVDFNCNLERKPGWVNCNLVYDSDVNDFTRNVTIGGRSSKKGTLQLYNKKVEVSQSRLSQYSDAIFNSVGCTDYWWRLEYRCKSFAQKVYDTLAQSKNIYQTFLCAANNMGAFVIPYCSVSHISQADTCIEWAAFLAFVLSLVGDNVYCVQFTPPVAVPYVGSELDKVKRFHSEQITSNDSINFLLLMLDSEYRRSIWNKVSTNLLTNKKLKPALNELRIKYGYKLSDLNELIWSQADIFDEVS